MYMRCIICNITYGYVYGYMCMYISKFLYNSISYVGIEYRRG